LPVRVGIALLSTHTHPALLPIIKAHGVGFKLPKDPFLTASRTSFTGAGKVPVDNGEINEWYSMISRKIRI